MNVYVLKYIYSQSQFTSYQGEVATDAESIVAVYTSESLAKKRKEELEYENQDWVGAGECWYTVETWPLTEEKANIYPKITDNIIIHCDTVSEALMLQYIAKEQGCDYLDAFGTISEDGNTYHFRTIDNSLHCCDVTDAGQKFFKTYEPDIIEFHKFFFGTSRKKMKQYGYEFKGMYGMTKERALTLFPQLNVPFFQLYDDGTDTEINNFEEIKSSGGLFGILKEDFENYVSGLYKKLTIEAPTPVMQ